MLGFNCCCLNYYDQTAVIPRHAVNTGSALNRNPLSATSKEYLFKVLVIGELGTGKTSFIKRYVHQFYSSHYRATIGVDFALKVLNWTKNTIVRVQLWDIAGQERFGQMTRVYYKEAAGAIIVFDVTRHQTFESVLKWKSDLDSKISLPDGSPIPCLLLANKCDEAKTGRLGDESVLNKFCEDHGFIGWFFTSPKDNVNIEESMQFLIRKVILKSDSTGPESESIVTSNINQVLSLTDPKKNLSSSCC